MTPVTFCNKNFVIAKFFRDFCYSATHRATVAPKSERTEHFFSTVVREIFAVKKFLSMSLIDEN